MTEQSSKIMNGILLIIVIAFGAKYFMDATIPKGHYSFTVSDRNIGRYESLEQCTRDEIIYRRVYLQENINRYETSCDWR